MNTIPDKPEQETLDQINTEIFSILRARNIHPQHGMTILLGCAATVAAFIEFDPDAFAEVAGACIRAAAEEKDRPA